MGPQGQRSTVAPGGAFSWGFAASVRAHAGFRGSSSQVFCRSADTVRPNRVWEVARPLDEAFENVVTHREGIMGRPHYPPSLVRGTAGGWRTAKFRRSSVPVVEERLTEAFGLPILDVARQDLRPGRGIERAVQFGRGQHPKP